MEEIDLCPKWWPWPLHHIPHIVEGPQPEPWDQIPAGGRVSLQLFRALTIYNMGFRYHNEAAQAQIQELALRQVGQLSAKLQDEKPGSIRRSGGRADDDAELCPPYWKWPFPPRRAPLGEGPTPEPWKEIPQGGQISLQIFRALTIFNMGYQYHDEDAQAHIQRLALGQVGELAAKLQKTGSD
jgi:hypothetical protein